MVVVVGDGVEVSVVVVVVVGGEVRFYIRSEKLT